MVPKLVALKQLTKPLLTVLRCGRGLVEMVHLCSIQCHGGGSQRSGRIYFHSAPHTTNDSFDMGHDLGLSLVCIHLTITYLHVVSPYTPGFLTAWWLPGPETKLLKRQEVRLPIHLLTSGPGNWLTVLSTYSAGQTTPNHPYSRQKGGISKNMRVNFFNCHRY